MNMASNRSFNCIDNLPHGPHSFFLRQLAKEFVLGIQHFVLTPMYCTDKFQLLQMIQTNAQTETFQNESYTTNVNSMTYRRFFAK